MRSRALDLPVHVVPLPPLRRPGPGACRGAWALGGLAGAAGVPLIHANGPRARASAAAAGQLAARPTLWPVRIAESAALLARALCAAATAVIATSRAV